MEADEKFAETLETMTDDDKENAKKERRIALETA
jgi:hypothetical protein